MAVVDGTNIPPPSPRRRGGLPVTVSGYRGLVVVRKRPGRKGPAKSPLQQAWVNDFACKARWSKYADWRARERAEELAPDTGWYWRDIIETGMAGKLRRRDGETPITTPTALVKQSSTTSLTINVDTAMTFDTLEWDNNYFWNPIANQSRLTVRSPGLYLVGATANFPVNSTGRRKIQIQKSDGTILAHSAQGSGTSSGGNISCVGIMYFEANSYARVFAQSLVASQTVQIQNFWILAITPENVTGS